MARQNRGEVFDPGEVSVWHCVNRCVRRCFLCGVDPVSARCYDHRKVWLEERFRWLAAHFGVDVLGFAILSNHFHLILRNRPDVVATWSDEEVARRWLQLCPLGKKQDGEPRTPTEQDCRTITGNPQRLATIRLRLSDIRWLMRMATEPVARLANREDCVTGRFWQGRIRAVKLCDEAALLACSVYVDLNPIRAGIAPTLEASDFTSVQRRIEARQKSVVEQSPHSSQSPDAETAPCVSTDETLRASALPPPARPEIQARYPDGWLTPLPLDEASGPLGPAPSPLGTRCSDKGFLPLSLDEYLLLVDWTARQVVAERAGETPERLAPLFARLGIAPQGWLQLSTDFGRLFTVVAGSCPVLQRERTRQSRRAFRCRHAHLLGTS